MTLAQGVLVPRFGRNVLTAGPLIMVVGFALFIAEIAAFGGELSPWAVVPVLFVTGTGMGCVVAPIYPFILAQVPVGDAGSASGVINAVGQVGGAIGRGGGRRRLLRPSRQPGDGQRRRRARRRSPPN